MTRKKPERLDRSEFDEFDDWNEKENEKKIDKFDDREQVEQKAVDPLGLGLIKGVQRQNLNRIKSQGIGYSKQAPKTLRSRNLEDDDENG